MSIVSGWCGGFSCAAASKYLPARPDVVRTLEADQQRTRAAPVRSRTSAGHPSVGAGAEFASLLAFAIFGTLAISLQRPVSESKVTRNNSDLL